MEPKGHCVSTGRAPDVTLMKSCVMLDGRLVLHRFKYPALVRDLVSKRSQQPGEHADPHVHAGSGKHPCLKVAGDQKTQGVTGVLRR
jgi:hypothetical protein